MLEYGSRGNSQRALVYTTVLKCKSCKELWKHIMVEFTLQSCNRLSKHMNSLTGLGVTSMHFLLTVSTQNWTRTSWELRKWSLTKEGLDLLNKFSLSALYGLENIWRMVWKIWIKILGCKELMWLSMYPLFRGQTWQCLIERVCDIVTWNRGSSVIFTSAQLILT